MNSKDNRLRRHLLIPVLFGLIFMLTPASSYISNIFGINGRSAESQKAFDTALVEEAFKKVQKFYVDRSVVRSPDLTYGAINGMVQSLGDTGHSTFLSPGMRKITRDATAGRFEGIGAEIQMKRGQLIIVAPLDGSPAEKAGLKPGDIILKVDGRDIADLPLAQVVEKIIGPAGTSVTLTIASPADGSSRDVTIERASVKTRNVTWQAVPGSGIALLRISFFSKSVADACRKSLEEITKKKLNGAVLDLRNNPGGLLPEVVGVVSQFLSGGNVLLEKNAEGEIKPVPVKDGGRFTNLPVVVLINSGSASGAEIVAGALQDSGRAKLVGETTFGTGTVLQEFPLSDGSALLLAVKEWLTPQGHRIWHMGINPDVLVKLTTQAVPLTPAKIRNLTAKQLYESGDTQLLRALEILRAQSAPERHSSMLPSAAGLI